MKYSLVGVSHILAIVIMMISGSIRQRYRNGDMNSAKKKSLGS